MKLTPLPGNRPCVIVASHERSGTHFLMNSIAGAYDYISDPQIDFDQHSIPINYYHAGEFANTLLGIGNGQAFANIVKSHHQADFFSEHLDRITQRYVICYIVRDPVKVMLSYWRFLHLWPWREGPRADDPITFSRSEPCGQQMRYQMHQHKNMVARWAAHVDGWLGAAERNPRIKIVRYEELDRKFDTAMRALATPLGIELPAELLDAKKPSRTENVVPGADHLETTVTEDDLRMICAETAGDLMEKLGYLTDQTQ